MTEAVIIKSMDWFLYDNGPRHERVKRRALIQSTPLYDLFKANFMSHHLHCIINYLTFRKKFFTLTESLKKTVI